MSSAMGRHAHWFQHVPYEGLGAIGAWLQDAGYSADCTRLHAGELPPAWLEGVDLLIVMGGPMGVNDEAELPWLTDEKRAIREAIDRGCPVLGVCLGAQLIASALGAAVYPNPAGREIGWFPIRAMPVAGDPLFPLPPLVDAFHWHGDTFDLPAGAMALARSDACENQVFHAGPSVLGLQCHLEITPEIAGSLIEHSGDQLRPSAWVQTAEEIRAADAGRYQRAHALLHRLLDRLTGRSGG